jgi:hypothetical protein
MERMQDHEPGGEGVQYHWSLRMSRQMAPVCELMLGCQIFVMNLTYHATPDREGSLSTTCGLGGHADTKRRGGEGEVAHFWW